jgi:SagB-type dehydrogenase family enzyme
MKQTKSFIPLIIGEKTPSIQYQIKSSVKELDRNILPYSKWKEAWKRIYYKEYPRFEKVTLQPDAELIQSTLLSSLETRESKRNFQKKMVSFDEVSTLLYYSAGINLKKSGETTMKRFYPSGGMRFPNEIYLLVREKAIGTLSQNSFHFNVKRNCLEKMFQIEEYAELVNNICSQEWVSQSNMVLCISAVFNRSKIKYGERGYRYCLFEAGHIAQNIYLLCSALGLKCCALGGFSDSMVNKHLELNGEDESAMYLFAIGR